MPSQSSASCMASVAFCTGFTGSQVSQSGHRPANGTRLQKERQESTLDLNAVGCTALEHTHTHTWCTAVYQCSQCPAVPPVLAEVVDRHIGEFVLDPAQQTLLRCLRLWLQEPEPAKKVNDLTSLFHGLMAEES